MAKGNVDWPKLPSPDTSSIRKDASFIGRVYEPAEDSFLFLDALQQDLPFIMKRAPSLIVEIGPGSGCIGIFLLQLFKACQSIPNLQEEHAFSVTKQSTDDEDHDHEPHDGEVTLPFVLSIDINSACCLATLHNLKTNDLPPLIDTVTSSLFHSIRNTPCFDVVLFNPPYVISDHSDVQVGCAQTASGSLTAAWAGGINGREVIDAFLDQLTSILSDTGVVYLLAESRNDIDDVMTKMEAMGLRVSKVLEQKRKNERLTVIRGCYPREKD